MYRYIRQRESGIIPPTPVPKISANQMKIINQRIEKTPTPEEWNLLSEEEKLELTLDLMRLDSINRSMR